MKASSRWIYPVMLAVVLSIGARAQEAEPPAPPPPAEDEDKMGWVFVEAADWISAATGLEYIPASERSDSGTALLTLPSGTENRFRFRAGYLFSRNIGEVILTWFSHEQVQEMERYSPGVFVFGELPVYPLYSGVNDDGLADGLMVGARTVLRDFRIDFQRIGFESPRMTVRWLVGYRKTSHERGLDGTYYSIFPVYQGDALPPFIYPQQISDPNPLAPSPDVASISSAFNGGGPEAGVELVFPLTKTIYLETGFTLALLNGTVKTEYTSETQFYALMDSSKANIERVLTPPYDDFDVPGQIGYIQQFDVPVGFKTSDSVSAQLLETYLGVRWKAWRGLEAFAGYRSARYTNVGADVQPSQVTWARDPATGRIVTTVASVSRTDHSANYEGLYLGVSYKY